jgi:hypothetical protein
LVICDKEVTPYVLNRSTIIVLSRITSGLPCRKSTPFVLLLVVETTIGGDIEAVDVIVADCPEQMVVEPVTEAVGEALTLIDLITEFIHPCMASVNV